MDMDSVSATRPGTKQTGTTLGLHATSLVPYSIATIEVRLSLIPV